MLFKNKKEKISGWGEVTPFTKKEFENSYVKENIFDKENQGYSDYKKEWNRQKSNKWFSL